jgi:peptide/nickel transport system substrate-binding protein
MRLHRGGTAALRWTERGRSRAVAVIGALLLLACGAVGLAACGGSKGGSGGASKTSVLRIGIGTEALPDPAKATVKGYWASVMFSLAYAPIFHLSPEGKVTPGLATSWRYVNDGADRNKVFEFTLRKNAKFSDGTPVTAKSVADWLTYFSKGTGPFSGVFGKKPKFEAVDDSTVRVNLATPNPRLPLVLSDGGPNAAFVMGPKAMADAKLLSSATDGAGPYMLDGKQSVRGDHYTYVPNPHYYDKAAVKFSRVEVRLIAEPASRLQTQKSGQLDVTLGDVTTASSAKSAGLKVLAAPQGVQYLVLDSKHGAVPQLRDIRVRQAINLAIDRKAIAKALLGDVGTPASAFIPADANTGQDDYWAYDPEKAKALLAQAGYAKGFSMKAICQGAYFGNLGEPLVRAVAKNLEAVGIKLDVTSYSTDPDYAKDVFDFKAPVINLLQILSDTPTVYGTYIAPSGVVNFYGTDPEIVRLYNAGLKAEDPTPSWVKMWQRFTTQAYVVPLVVNPNLYYVSKSIAGVSVSKVHNSALPTEWSPAA